MSLFFDARPPNWGEETNTQCGVFSQPVVLFLPHPRRLRQVRHLSQFNVTGQVEPLSRVQERFHTPKIAMPQMHAWLAAATVARTRDLEITGPEL